MKNTLLFKHTKLGLLLVFILFSSLGWGQTTVTIGGGATVVTPNTPTATWTTPPTGVSFSNWSRGSGVGWATSSTALSGTGFNTTSAAFSYSGNKFYSFTITAASTHSFTLNNIVWNTVVSGTFGSANFTVQYSNNGGALTTLGTAAQTGTNTNTFTAASTITVAAGTSIVVYLIPSGVGTSGSTVRLVNGSTVSVTAISAATSPAVTNTTPATSITTTAATLAGNVTATGGANITGNGSVYSLTTSNAAPQIAGTGVTQVATTSPTTGTGTFSNAVSTTLLVNRQYSFNAYATNSVGTSYGTASTFYTLANTPNAPTVSNPTTSTLDVALGASDGNPAATEYAIKENNSGKYVQSNGTLNTTAVWQDASTWGTKTVTGLAPSTAYTFLVQARNGANTLTTFGSTASGTTSTATTPTISGATTAAAFTTTYGTASDVQTFSISGVNLTEAITATAPTGFQVSSDGTNYGTTATFALTGSSVSGSLRVILIATATVSGTYNAQNIVLSSTGATDANIATTATGNSVAPAPLTISGLSASDKPYDRGTSVTISGIAAFTGLKNGETFIPSGTVTWAFADGLAAIGKTVTRTGTYAVPSANYTLTQPSLSARIIELALTTSGTATVTPKTYDRTTTANLTGIALVGVISPDVVTIVGTYNDKTVSTGKPVTLVLSGADSANYSWTAPSVTGDITSAPVTITSPAVTNKLYDGTNTATITGTLDGVVSLDIVTLNGTGTFASTAIGINISVTSTATLSGADAGNYTLTQPTGLTGNIIVQEAGLLLLEDNFNYTGTLTANGWLELGTSATPSVSSGTSNGLSYTNYGSSSIGNAAILTTSGQDVYKTFTSQNPDSGTSTVYYSALVNISATQAGAYFLAFTDSNTSNYRARIFAKTGSAATKILFGISNNGNTINYTTTEYNTNTPILLVVKFTFTTTTCTSSLFINPSLYSEPNSVSISDNTASNNTFLNSIILRQATGTTSPTLVVDGIRVATNWGALLGNPQYTVTSNIAAGNYNTVNVLSGGAVTALGNVASKTLNIEASGSLAVTTGNNLTIDGAITNAGTLTVFNNANLIQGGTSNSNIGNIIVNRDSASIQLYDYTLWSSPVAGQNLRTFSSSTLATRFYTYNSTSNLYNVVDFTNPVYFAPATGYLIRAPNDHNTTPTVWNGTFTGVPNNGNQGLSSLTPNKYYATGNPYPSTISADLFLGGNNTGGTLYFWRKTNNALTSSYATYTLAGGTGTGTANSGDPLNLTPNGIIQVGQGFIVKTGAGAGDTTLNFTNAMRTANNDNQFLRTTNQKSRYWLNLTSTTGAFCQTMVAYMPEATSGVDNAIDGRYFNDSPVALTSIINAEEYTIQGRALPFATTDTVPLGFKTNAAGNYTIAIDHVDGLFSTGQTVFLKDNLLNTVVDLSAGSYSFASAIGTFNSRFEVVYQSTLAVTNPTFTANSVIAFSANGEISINSGSTIMELVRVYDLQGRLLVEKKQVNATETKLSTTATNQVLLVEITAANGSKITKKIIQ